MAVSMIARRQPMAQDLRAIITAIHVAGDLERVGDMAKTISRRTLQIEGLSLTPKFYNGVKHMADLILRQLKAALDAYAARDAGAAVNVFNSDDEIDALYTSLFRELLTYMMEDPRNITFCTHLLFCAKNIERIGDHATNIAETIQPLSQKLQSLSEELTAVVRSVDRNRIASIVDNVDKFTGALGGSSADVAKVVKDAASLSAKLDRAADQVEGVLKAAKGFLESGSGPDGRSAFQEVADAAKSIRTLADNLDKRSAGLIIDGRRTLADISRAVNNFDRNPTRVLFGASNRDAAPAQPTPAAAAWRMWRQAPE